MVDLKLLKRLEELRRFTTVEELDEFLYILSLIGEADDPDYLPFLFTYVSDTPRYKGVYYWLILVIMGHNSEALITYLLSNLEEHYKRIPICLCEFFARFLDVPQYLQILQDNIHIADKKTLLSLLKDVAEYSNDGHKAVTNKLNKILSDFK